MRKKKVEGLIWAIAGTAFVAVSAVITCAGMDFWLAVGLLVTGCLLSLIGLKKIDNANREADRIRRNRL